MDSSALARLVADGEKRSYDSLLIVRHGRLVVEAYYAPYTGDVPHNLFSSTKAVTSTLIGLTREDGQLDRLDHPVLDFFADRRIANVDDRKRAMTVQSLLDMTSGLDWDQGFEGGKQQSMNDLYRHKLVNMHASYDPDQSYSNLFWIFPGKHAYMANGKNGQLIVVFPDQDIVAVTTARKQLRLEAFIDAVSAAVESDTALPPNTAAAAQLANAVKDAAVEKPMPIGATPEIAARISGKTYRFPEKSLGLASLTLDLTGSSPHVEFEGLLRFPAGSSVEYSQPIGLDGLYRKGEPKLSDPAIGHVSAAKGTWSDDHTFVIDAPIVGFGEQQRFILSFSGNKLNLKRMVAVGEGDEFSIDGERGD